MEITEDESKAFEFIANMVVGTKLLKEGFKEEAVDDLFSNALYWLSQVSDEEIAKAYNVYYGG